MNCTTADNLKVDYLNAVTREEQSKQGEARAVKQMQQEIARTQTEHSIAARDLANQLLLELELEALT